MKAAEYMKETGAGLFGIDHVNYRDWVVDNVCRYYVELLPIMRNRPNVTPWFTNHDDGKDDSESESDNNTESDIESEEGRFSVSGESDTEISITEVLVTKVTPGKRVFDVDVVSKSTGSNGNNSASISGNVPVQDGQSLSSDNLSNTVVGTSTANNCSNGDKCTIDNNNDNTLNTASCSANNTSQQTKNTYAPSPSRSVKRTRSKNISPKSKNDSTSSSSKKMSPIQAKSVRKNEYKNKTKQINSKKKKNKTGNAATIEVEEREYLNEQRQLKMKFELDIHNDLKRQHVEKMSIEKTRLEMEKEELQNKKILNKVEILRARIEFKKQDPTITEEFLNIHFPMD
jgi:hypothetical protein